MRYRSAIVWTQYLMELSFGRRGARRTETAVNPRHARSRPLWAGVTAKMSFFTNPGAPRFLPAAGNGLIVEFMPAFGRPVLVFYLRRQ